MERGLESGRNQLGDDPGMGHASSIVSADSGTGPGGMAVGPDGNLYVAVIGAGVVRVYSADGQWVRDIQMPGKNPSNCAFDSWSGLGLVVTETEKGELLSVSM